MMVRFQQCAFLVGLSLIAVCSDRAVPEVAGPSGQKLPLGIASALAKVEGDGSPSRVVFASDGLVYIGTTGTGQSYQNGYVYRWKRGMRSAPELILELGAETKRNKEEGVFSAFPYLVDALKSDILILNVNCLASFPAGRNKDDGGVTRNIILYDVKQRKLKNLTKLRRKDGRLAEAIVYVPEENVILGEFMKLYDAKQPMGKRDTATPVFFDLKGNELPKEKCPLSAKLYSNWRRIYPKRQVTRVGKKAWNLVVRREQQMTMTLHLAKHPGVPRVRQLAGGLFYFTGRGFGTYVIDVRSDLVAKISPDEALGFNRRNSMMVFLARERKGTRRFPTTNVRQLFQETTDRLIQPAPSD